MITEKEKEERFIELLLEIRNGKHTNKKATQMLRERILALGSETPDNLNCVNHIEIGKVTPGAGPLEARCIKVRGRDIRVVDVMHTIEDARMPKSVRDRYPDLTTGEWSACLRLATLVLMMFEQDSWPGSMDRT